MGRFGEPVGGAYLDSRQSSIQLTSSYQQLSMADTPSGRSTCNVLLVQDGADTGDGFFVDLVTVVPCSGSECP